GSVLGRIGLAYLFANLIYLYAKPKTQLIWFVGILIGYWFLLLFGARPNHQMGDLTMEGNIVSYLDTLLMPGKLYLGIHDPEGLVSTIPAISTALLGIFTGNLLKNTRLEERTKTAVILCVLGILFLSIAQIWNLVFPINKNLWTSSFTLYCGGLSLLLMALFYYLIDVRGHRKWAFFFKVIGMNSIFIYMSVVFIDWGFTANKLFAWLGQLVGAPYSSVVLIMASLVVQWGCLYFLYRRKYFLRV
ncbi:MAG: acyltransferase family protein, partial [Flammeovirgaceae bacterium]